MNTLFLKGRKNKYAYQNLAPPKISSTAGQYYVFVLNLKSLKKFTFIVNLF